MSTAAQHGNGRALTIAEIVKKHPGGPPEWIGLLPQNGHDDTCRAVIKDIGRAMGVPEEQLDERIDG